MTAENKAPWDGFIQELNERLEVGRNEYPDSPTSSPFKIIKEWQQEALDIAGWGYVLWQRIEDMKVEIRKSGITGKQDAIAEEVLSTCIQCVHFEGRYVWQPVEADFKYCHECGRKLVYPYRAAK